MARAKPGETLIEALSDTGCGWAPLLGACWPGTAALPGRRGVAWVKDESLPSGILELSGFIRYSERCCSLIRYH